MLLGPRETPRSCPRGPRPSPPAPFVCTGSHIHATDTRLGQTAFRSDHAGPAWPVAQALPSGAVLLPWSLSLPVHRTRIPAPPYVARQDCSPLSVRARTLLPDVPAPAKPPAVCFHVNHPDNRVSELLSPAFKSSACSSLTAANIPTCPLWSSLFPSP